jgi:predicted AlkP superfamily pyrophosphatase or phosphodiesterase
MPHPIRRLLLGVSAGVLALLASCAPAAQRPTLPPDAGRRHVVVISVDGLRPDAIERSGATTLQRMAAEGAWSWTAQTVVPSRTLPSHTSMWTGVGPDRHRIDWNTNRTGERGRVGVETAFGVAREHGVRTGAFFAKPKLRHLMRPGSLDRASAPRGVEIFPATRMVDDVETYLRFHRPGLLFVHLAEPDVMGHAFGWMSPPYRWGVRRADAAVGRIAGAALRHLGPGVVVIVTSDHGGRGREHAAPVPENLTIPWIAWGPAVAAGRIQRPIHTVDTAATVLWLLGVPVPAEWQGEPVREILPPHQAPSRPTS